jgi:hypothetical protein
MAIGLYLEAVFNLPRLGAASERNTYLWPSITQVIVPISSDAISFQGLSLSLQYYDFPLVDDQYGLGTC